MITWLAPLACGSGHAGRHIFAAATHTEGVSYAVEQDEAADRPECWCCGRPFDESELTRLGQHPEVGVCADCARWLHRRSRAAAGEGHPSAGARAARAVDSVRSYVIEHHWHERPVIGPLLRRLDRHLP